MAAPAAEGIYYYDAGGMFRRKGQNGWIQDAVVHQVAADLRAAAAEAKAAAELAEAKASTFEVMVQAGLQLRKNFRKKAGVQAASSADAGAQASSSAARREHRQAGVQKASSAEAGVQAASSAEKEVQVSSTTTGDDEDTEETGSFIVVPVPAESAAVTA